MRMHPSANDYANIIGGDIPAYLRTNGLEADATDEQLAAVVEEDIANGIDVDRDEAIATLKYGRDQMRQNA